MNPIYLTVEDCEQESAQVLSAAEVLYRGTARLQRLRTLGADYVADMRGLLENRGIRAPTIGFIGEKNAGKSHLMRSLIVDKAVGSQLPCGLGADGRTEKLVWVGAELPELDPNAELGFRLHDSPRQLMLDPDVTLVDVPGFNDAFDAAAVRARELALKSCQVKVLIIDTFASEAERCERYVEANPGPIIVPVVNMVRQKPDAPEVLQQIAEYEARIRGALERGGVSTAVLVQPAIAIPDENILAPDVAAEAHAKLVAAINSAIAEVRRNPGLVQHTALMRRARYLDAVRAELDQDFRRIADLLDKIERDLALNPGQLVPQLMGGEHGTTATIRRWLRADLLFRIPTWFFPMRTFTGLLVLGSRAWDALASIGDGLPSLLGNSFRILPGLRFLRLGLPKRPDNSLETRLGQLLADRHHDDLAALRRHLDGMQSNVSTSKPIVAKPQIVGLPALRVAAMECFEQIIRAWAPGGWMIYLTGCVSLLLFLLLLLGPLSSVYGHELAMVWRSAKTGGEVDWTAFSVPPMGVIAGWLVIALLPPLAAAILLQALATSANRINRCRAAVENALRELVDKLQAREVLVVTLKDTKFDACRFLYRRFFRT